MAERYGESFDVFGVEDPARPGSEIRCDEDNFCKKTPDRAAHQIIFEKHIGLWLEKSIGLRK